MNYLKLYPQHTVRRIGNATGSIYMKVRNSHAFGHFTEELRAVARAEGVCAGGIELGEALFARYVSDNIGYVIPFGLGIGVSVVGSTLLGDSIRGRSHYQHKYSYVSRQFPLALGYDIVRASKSFVEGVVYGLPGLFVGREEEKKEMRRKASASFLPTLVGEGVGITLVSVVGGLGVHGIVDDIKSWESWFLSLSAIAGGVLSITIAKSGYSHREEKKNNDENSN